MSCESEKSVEKISILCEQFEDGSASAVFFRKPVQKAGQPFRGRAEGCGAPPRFERSIRISFAAPY